MARFPRSAPVPAGWWRGRGWGQVPTLHLSFDPRLLVFARPWLVSPAGAGIHPGSEYRDMLFVPIAHAGRRRHTEV